jgi:hypothetical protein
VLWFRNREMLLCKFAAAGVSAALVFDGFGIICVYMPEPERARRLIINPLAR